MLAFVGGTGPEGRGLALRLALAGEEVLIGSRDAARAQAAAEQLVGQRPGLRIRGLENAAAAAAAEVVFLCVPYEGHRATVEALRPHLEGKVVVDVVAPLAFSRGRARALQVEEGSAAQQAQAVMPNSKVVAAFQNLSARELAELEHEIPSDVVVCADDKEAKQAVIALAAKIKGIRGVDGGGLDNARYVEDLTALLLNVNRIYKAQSSIKFVGL